MNDDEHDADGDDERDAVNDDDEHDAVGCAVDDDDGEHPRLFILAYINDIKR